MSTFLHCYNRMKDGEAFFSRDQIEVELCESLRVFKNNLMALGREDIILWSPLDGGFAVQVIDGD